jgi:hypothetical protein
MTTTEESRILNLILPGRTLVPDLVTEAAAIAREELIP